MLFGFIHRVSYIFVGSIAPIPCGGGRTSVLGSVNNETDCFCGSGTYITGPDTCAGIHHFTHISLMWHTHTPLVACVMVW